MLVIGWFAVHEFLQIYDMPLTYTFPTQQAYIYNTTNAGTSNVKENIVIQDGAFNLEFSATSFSAQSPIMVKAMLFPTSEYDMHNNWKYVPQKQVLVFPSFSIHENTTKTTQNYAAMLIFLNRPSIYSTPSNGTLTSYVQSPFIILTKHTDPDYYYGEEKITYMFEGTYSYAFLDTILANAPANAQYVIYPQNYEQGGIPVTLKEPAKFIDFTVSSSDSTSTIKTNDIFVALTLVTIAFGVIGSHKLIVSGVGWIGGRFG